MKKVASKITNIERLKWLIDKMKLHVVTLDQTIIGRYRLVIGGKRYPLAYTAEGAIDIAMKGMR